MYEEVFTVREAPRWKEEKNDVHRRARVFVCIGESAVIRKGVCVSIRYVVKLVFDEVRLHLVDKQ